MQRSGLGQKYPIIASMHKKPEYDWDQTVYHGVEEEIPDDAPPPKGKPVRITTYVDASCYIVGQLDDLLLVLFI